MKDNKKTIIVLIVLAIGLLFCASIIIFKNNNSNNNNYQNIINIDDCAGIDCNNNKEDKSNKDKNQNVDDNNSSQSSGSENESNSESTSNSGSVLGVETISENEGNSVSENVSNSNSENKSNSGSVSESNSQSVSGVETNSESEDNSSSVNDNSSSSESESNPDNGSDENSGNGEDTVPSVSGAVGIEVSDDDITWETNTSLNIFDVDKIKPGDQGTYKFAVNNNVDDDVIYSIVFSENNQYNVNLLYKLQLNDEYISGDSETWVKYDQLNLDNKVLGANYMDSYLLMWKWVDSDHDTAAGVAKNATYTLGVSVLSKQATDQDDTQPTNQDDKQTRNQEVKGVSIINPRTGDKIALYVIMFIESIIALLIIILLKRKQDEDDR